MPLDRDLGCRTERHADIPLGSPAGCLRARAFGPKVMGDWQRRIVDSICRCPGLGPSRRVRVRK